MLLTTLGCTKRREEKRFVIKKVDFSDKLWEVRNNRTVQKCLISFLPTVI